MKETTLRAILKVGENPGFQQFYQGGQYIGSVWGTVEVKEKVENEPQMVIVNRGEACIAFFHVDEVEYR